MPYLLFTISYLVDLILLILLIILIIGIFQLLKTVKSEYSMIEKLKIAPKLITGKSSDLFEQIAARDANGTFLVSYHKHKDINKIVRRLIGGTLGFIGIKLVIVSLIFLQIPRLGEAQPKIYTALYQASSFNSFSKGKFTQTQWDNDSIDLQPGQLDGNYISVPIGDGVSNNHWKNLSYKTDIVYGLAPSLPNTIATWQFDSLDKCTDSKYSCKVSGVNLTEGLYGSNAYQFDGEKSLVKIDQNVSPTGSFTIAAWIKPDQTILNGSEDQNYVIFAKGYGDYTAKPPYIYKYQLFFGFKNGALSLIYWPDSNPDHWVMAQNNKNNFNANEWYNIAGVYDDKNKTLKLYIDGIEQSNILADYDDKSTNSLNSKVHLSPNLKDNLPSWIGGTAFKWMDGQEKPNNIFEGTIDHVILSNSVSTFTDIKNMVTSSGNISFQIRTGNTLPLSGPFYGPKGDPTAFFKNQTNNDLSFVADSKYLQYICFINRPNTNFNPKLTNIFVDYTTSSEPNLVSASSTNISNSATLTRDPAKEKEATDLFYQFFKANPKTAADQQFIDTLAYGQVQSRDLATEQKALTAFVKHYKRMPASDLDWRIIKVLAYTDEGTVLMKSWLGLK